MGGGHEMLKIICIANGIRNAVNNSIAYSKLSQGHVGSYVYISLEANVHGPVTILAQDPQASVALALLFAFQNPQQGDHQIGDGKALADDLGYRGA